MKNRRHEFEGILNFRDFGGYAGSGGRRIASGRFFRSGHHGGATDSDLERLRSFGFATIVDLRRPRERAGEPSRRWPGFGSIVVENHSDDEGREVWHEFLARCDMSAESFRNYLLRYYPAAPFMSRHVDLFARYFAALARDTGPLLVHCAGGKDRTGMLVALTHALAGVHRDDILQDFLLTNDPAIVARRGPQWVEWVREQHGRAPTLEAASVVMAVEPSYLEAAFEAILAQHGSVERYLRDVLGVDAAKQRAIEARLFE